MFEDVLQTLEETLGAWDQMKRSSMDDAGNDADRFQMMFYVLMEHIESWVDALDSVPEDAETARTWPQFAQIYEVLPEELQLPFDMELDRILSGKEQNIDSTEQG